jgi:hypothetical protein
MQDRDHPLNRQPVDHRVWLPPTVPQSARSSSLTLSPNALALGYEPVPLKNFVAAVDPRQDHATGENVNKI